ncbi:hypothetical protein EVAR_87150_1 [Eumeta japonica]|uniref:Zinc finger MYM-type protein 1 n=1 Tax=Eumeta variegata TaxID=151549 RepID=A0A4C1VWK2_EUMVA|nr:hypothetical protein EVAR_87150_1 [Eumeta japonica]
MIMESPKALVINESFLGFHEAKDQTALAMKQIIKSINDKNIPLNKCRGQGYDGANTMEGTGGVQKLIKDIEPNAVCVHCAAHNLNLVLNDAVGRAPPKEFATGHRWYSYATGSSSFHTPMPIAILVISRVFTRVNGFSINCVNATACCTNGPLGTGFAQRHDRDTSTKIYNKKKFVLFYKNLGGRDLSVLLTRVGAVSRGRAARTVVICLPVWGVGPRILSGKNKFKLSLGLLAKPELFWLRWGHRDRLPETETVPPKPGRMVTLHMH